MRNFVYNENNHIIAEYDNNNNVIAEYYYSGLRPVAVKTNGVLYAVHTDYLGTPRLVTTAANGGNVIWQWKNDNPYGNNKAEGNIEFNLRFAGQYYDVESNLHYNMNRTYNPELGRYLQSDPIGLAGGTNTYNYVNKNPLDGVDPLGLDGIGMELSHTNDSKSQKNAWATETREKMYFSNNDKETLYIVSHGSPNSMSGMLAPMWSDMIYNGKIHDLSGNFVQNSEYIARRLKEGKDINIFLDACNTASPYMEGDKEKDNFAVTLGKELRILLNQSGYQNTKINITAPSGWTEWPGEYFPWSRSPASDIITPMYIMGTGKHLGRDSAGKLEYYKY